MSNRLPPEVLECIAAHLLAVTWLVDEVQDIGPWCDLERDDLVALAQRKGLERYRRMTPMDIERIAAQALENYRAIAGQLDFETPDDIDVSDNWTPDVL